MVSTSLETTNHPPSKPVKKLQSDSTSHRKHLTFDDLGNEAPQSRTTNEEKNLTPVKTIRSAIKPDVSPLEHLSPISADGSDVSTNQKHQLDPDKANLIVAEPERFPHKNSSLGQKEMDKAEFVDLESRTSASLQRKLSLIRKIVRNEVDRKSVTSNSKDPEITGNPEKDNKTPEKSNEEFKISTLFAAKVKNSEPFEKVRIISIPTMDDEKRTGHGENAASSDNQISTSRTKKNTCIHKSESEGNYFSPIKKSEISGDPATNVHESDCFDYKDKMPVHSNQDRKKNTSPNQGSTLFENVELKRNSLSPRREAVNISPNQGNNSFKNFKGERKSPSPRTDTVLFSSMPRIINLSTGMQIEIFTSCLLIESPSPPSPISQVDYRMIKTETESIHEEKSPKGINFSVYESKPGCSRDTSPSAKRGSPPVLANTSSPVSDDVFYVGSDLSITPSKESPRASSSAALPSIRIKHMDSNTLDFYITQLSCLISKREVYMLLIYHSLISLRKSLEYLITHIESIVNIIQNIASLNRDYVTEDLSKDSFCLITIASKFIKTLGSLKSDLQSDLQFWTGLFQQIDKIKSQYGPMIETIEKFHAFNEELKTKWETLDKTLPTVESRTTLFFSTTDDFEKCINLFVKCLITIGVLKPS